MWAIMGITPLMIHKSINNEEMTLNNLIGAVFIGPVAIPVFIMANWHKCVYNCEVKK